MKNLDNIEDGFKDKFDHKNVANEGWNMPSDHVWENIEQDLKKDSDDSRGYLFYMILSGLFVSILAFGILFAKYTDLSEEIVYLRQSKKAIQNESNQRNPLTKSIKIGKSTSTNKLNQEQKDNSLVQNTFRQFDVARKQNLKQKSQNKSINLAKISSSSKSQTQNINKTTEFTNYNTDNLVVAIENEIEIIIIPSITNQPIRLIEINVRPLPKLELNGSTEPIQIKANTNSYFAIRAGVGQVNLNNSGSQETALSELIAQEYGATSYHLSAEYGKQLSSRISTSIGLSLKKQSFITEYDVTLPYDQNLEILENGSGYIDFEHSLPTSFGNTDTGLRLLRTRASDPLAENTVKLDFDTEHSFISICLPMRVNYHFGNQPTGLSMGFVAVPTYNVSAKSGIHSAISLHSDILSTNNYATSDYKTLKKTNLNLGVDIKYTLPISKSSNLGLSLGYWQNINPHFSTNNFSSKMSGIELASVYRYYF